MTGRAIRIATQGLGRIRAGILAVGRLVLMRMVAEVLGRSSGFMLAITGHCRPTELKRQEHQQDEGQPFAHRGNSVAVQALLCHSSLLGFSQSPVRVACLLSGSSCIKSEPLRYSASCGRFDDWGDTRGRHSAGYGQQQVNRRSTFRAAHVELLVIRCASHRQPAGASSALRNS